MSTTSAVGKAGADTRAAVRFFWVWLCAATAMSVGGNVTHAIIDAPGRTVALAAAAAVVPPAVLLGSTHSVALLIKTRRLGPSYWCALTMTVALAGCAFVLSFDALRDLAVTLVFRPDRAWLWPVAIDVSIAQSTLALLSLTPPTRVRAKDAAPQHNCPRFPRTVIASASDTSARPVAPSSGENRARSLPPGPPHPVSRIGHRTMSALPATPLGRRRLDPAALLHWKPTADQLVRDGVTSKAPDVVATILAEHAAGTPPSTIGRRQNVHHTTVGRILSAAQSRTG